jgi:hypothetical protein
MVATQQVQEKGGMRPNKEWLACFNSQKAVAVYTKASKYLSRLQLLEHQNIDHTTESTTEDRPNQQNHHVLADQLR